MYIYAETVRDEVVVWERTEKGREVKYFQAPWYFYAPDEEGEFESIYGERLAKYTFKSRKEFNAERNSMLASGISLYESDIPPELKILSCKYYGAKTPNLNVTFFDIEVDFDEKIGFSSTKNPYAPINSIALYHMFQNEYVLITVPPEPGWTEARLRDELKELPALFGTDPKFTILICRDERELLLNFLEEIENSDVISGYNNEFFDDPMIGKRIEITLGEKYLRRLSFKGAREPRWTEVERMGNTDIGLDIYGRISADYLKLIKKYEVVERQSYKLESVAEDKLPNLPKLKYKGNLSRLYRENYAFFCRYNLRDTEILYGFESKMRYIALANEMYHMSTGLFPGVFTTLRLSDLSIINHCHYEMNKIVPDGKDIKSDDSIQGAHVLNPVVGMHDWVGAIDINSLYPSSIRSINISPETIIGQFEETETAQKEVAKKSDMKLRLRVEGTDEVLEKTAKEWNRIIRKSRWAISGYGTVYDQNFEGVIPAVLKSWFEMRKVHKKKMAEYERKMDEIKAKYQVSAK